MGLIMLNGKPYGGSSIATTDSAGIVKPDGTTITVDSDGTIHGTGSGGSSVVVTPSLTSGTEIATIKVDDTTSTLYAPDISTKVDKTTTIAGVDLQDNITKEEMLTALNVEDGANNYTLPVSSTVLLGGVKVDGTSITADADGTVHAVSDVVVITQAEYDANKEYYDSLKKLIYISDAESFSFEATEVEFDNTGTELTSTNVQSAVKELYDLVKNLQDHSAAVSDSGSLTF